MKRAAIVYASYDGHTKRISEKIQGLLAEKGQNVALIHIDDFSVGQLADYEFVAFGSPIRYGKHLPAMVDFLTRHQTILAQKGTAFFSVNLTARKDNRNTPETSVYVRKFLAKLSWQPDMVEVFAGQLNYSIYRFHDRQIIRFIMWLTKGPTSLKTVADFTDWQQVCRFADDIYRCCQTIDDRPTDNQ